MATTRYSDGTSASVTTLFEHDLRGRPIASQEQIATPSGWGVTTALPTYQLTTAYNDANQATTTQTRANGVVEYATTQQYETPSGMLKGLANMAGSTLATLNYQAQGLLDSISFQTNTNTALATDQFSYDNDLRPIGNTATWQSGSGSSGTIVGQTRNYDPAGNVISLATNQAAVPGQSNSGGSETQNFCYDEQNRLVWAGNTGTQPSAGSGTCGHGTLANGLSGGTESDPYACTHLGQLWLGHVNGGATTSQHLYCDSSHPHQLTGIYPAGATCSSKGTPLYTSSYDAWGNVTSRGYSGANATLHYDALDHFTQWDVDASNQEWYVYDAAGNRVLKRTTSLSGTTLTTFPFGGMEEHTFTSSGTPSGGDHYYYSLDGKLIGELNGTATQFFLLDGLGSPLSSISNTGSAAIQGNQLFDPYGERRYHAGTVGTSKQFTGQYNDGQTGLNYFNARYYDSVAGVFLSADSVQGNAQGMNPYAYVGGNPETKTDPTGHDGGITGFCDATCWMQAITYGLRLGLSNAELGEFAIAIAAVGIVGAVAQYEANHPTNYAQGCGCSAPMATVENEMANDIAGQGVAYGSALPRPLTDTSLENILEGLKQEQDFQRQRALANYNAFAKGYTHGMNSDQRRRRDPKNAMTGVGLLYVAFPDGKPYMMKPLFEISYKNATSGVDHAEDLMFQDAIKVVSSLDLSRFSSVHLVMYTQGDTCDLCVDNLVAGEWLDKLYAASGRPTFLYMWTGDDPMPYMDERG